MKKHILLARDQKSWNALNRHRLVKGTLLLTATGFITRILGFLYKIYLADLMGAEMLGMYQLIFPVYAVCFTIYGAGMQTAISQCVATELGRTGSRRASLRLPLLGTATAFSVSVLLQMIILHHADLIASRILLEPALSPYLKILCHLFPFCCLSACINGYYYGIQAARVPAFAQLIEQIARISFVFLMCQILPGNTNKEGLCRLAVEGLVAGEAVACIYNVWKVCSLYRRGRTHQAASQKGHVIMPFRGLRFLLWLASTLTVTRLFMTLLNSAEAILLPAMLRKYGCSSSDALSIYGVLTGMSLSFLLFPSTVTNSLAVMLIPSIAEADARNDRGQIRRSLLTSIRYCLLFGILCTSIFLIFGHELGTIFFHNEDAGNYLSALSWLCPFLYLGTTLTGIINGMKKNQVTFLITVISLGIKLLMLTEAVPVWGIHAYLVGLLVSQLVQVLLELIYLRNYILYRDPSDSGHSFDPVRWIFLPALFLIPMGWAAKSSYRWISSCMDHKYQIFSLCLTAGMYCLFYAGFLMLTGILGQKAANR